MKRASFYDYDWDYEMSDKTAMINHATESHRHERPEERLDAPLVGFSHIIGLIAVLFIICALVEWSASI